MAQATLRNRIKRIQTHLGVPADGLIGPTTLTAIEDVLFEDFQEEIAVENFSLTVSRKGLKPLVEQQDYTGISLQIKAMKRLWEDKGLDGLLKRRDDEAKLISQSNRAYEASEIVRI